MSTTTNKYLAYWREKLPPGPFANEANSVDEYEQAHGYGVAWSTRFPGHHTFHDVESDLSRYWTASRGTASDAHFLKCDAWDRVTTSR